MARRGLGYVCGHRGDRYNVGMRQTLPLLLTLFAMMCFGGCGDDDSSTRDASPDVTEDATEDTTAEDTTPAEDTAVADTAPEDTNRPPVLCPSDLTVTTAMRLDIPATWDPEDPDVTAGIPGYDPGEGVMHVWLRQELAFEESEMVSATVRLCGNLLPEVQKNIGYMGAIQLDTPVEVFDALEDELSTTVTFESLEPDAPFSVDPQWLVLGADFDPDGDEEWPEDWTRTAALRERILDPDGDGVLGLTAFPRTGEGFVPPITIASATANPMAASTADAVGVALRARFAISGERVGCLEATGAAELESFDAQVVDCHRLGSAEGRNCTRAQARFVHSHTPVFRFAPGTFEMKLGRSTDTCADIREALPVPE